MLLTFTEDVLEVFAMGDHRLSDDRDVLSGISGRDLGMVYESVELFG